MGPLAILNTSYSIKRRMPFARAFKNACQDGDGLFTAVIRDGVGELLGDSVRVAH